MVMHSTLLGHTTHSVRLYTNAKFGFFHIFKYVAFGVSFIPHTKVYLFLN